MKTSQLSFWLGAATPVPTCATVASAHPGHDLGAASFGHIVSSPDHAIWFVALGCLLYLVSGFVSRPAFRKVLQCSAAGLMLTPLFVSEI